MIIRVADWHLSELIELIIQSIWLFGEQSHLKVLSDCILFEEQSHLKVLSDCICLRKDEESYLSR